MNIGLDFDGVIANAGLLKSEIAKERFGFWVPPEHFKKETIVTKGLLTVAEYFDFTRSIFGEMKYGTRMKEVPRAIEHIQRLLQLGHQVSVVTSRAQESLEVAKAWCDQKSLQINIEGVGTGNTKAGACSGLDVFIDDDLDKLEPLVEVVPHRFLFSWEYNEHHETGAIAKRVSGWPDFFTAITALT